MTCLLEALPLLSSLRSKGLRSTLISNIPKGVTKSGHTAGQSHSRGQSWWRCSWRELPIGQHLPARSAAHDGCSSHSILSSAQCRQEPMQLGGSAFYSFVQRESPSDAAHAGQLVSKFAQAEHIHVALLTCIGLAFALLLPTLDCASVQSIATHLNTVLHDTVQCFLALQILFAEDYNSDDAFTVSAAHFRKCNISAAKTSTSL